MADIAHNQTKPDAAARPVAGNPRDAGQTVLVLQGGGALGAYQVGVYQALHEAGIEPAWVIGTSIGAINGASTARSGKPFAELDAAAQHDFVDQMRQNKIDGWKGPGGGFVYLILRSDAVGKRLPDPALEKLARLLTKTAVKGDI